MAPVLPVPCFSDGVPAVADGGPRSGETHTSAFAHVGAPRGGSDGVSARAAAAIVFSPDGAGEGLLDSSSADTPLCGCGGQSFAEPAGGVCHGGHPSAGFVSLSPSASADAGADARGEQEGTLAAAASAGSTGLCREASCFASPTRATSIVSLGSMDGSIGDILTFAQACPQEERWRAEYLPVVAHIVQRVGRGLRDRRRAYVAFVRSVVEEDGSGAAAAAEQPKHLHFKELCEASSRSWREKRLRCGGGSGANRDRGGSHGPVKCSEASPECVGGGERCASASPAMLVFSLSAADSAKPKLD